MAPRRGTGAKLAVPAAAFALALGSAFLHALWNVMLARERDPEPATAIAICTSVLVFAPVAAVVWDVDSRVWPYIAVTSLLQLLYFALLATAYRRAELSFVYPIARGLAPVLVLVVGVVALGTGATVAQAAGVCLVGLGIVLVRGLGGERDVAGGALAVAIASSIAGYTLVDKSGIRYANPITYLELGMLPTALGALLLVALLPAGHARMWTAVRPIPALAGVVSFAAYALVLAALQRAPAASVAAVRETSVLIVAVLASRALDEQVGRARLAGAALVVAGVALIVL
jgi:drug/metabolite transporter (DMT)-like permease